MDFLERIFGFSPDGGNGLTEAAIFIALTAAAGLHLLLRHRRRSNRGA